MSDETLKTQWARDTAKLLTGRTISRVRYMTPTEQEACCWYRAAIVLELDNGELLWPSADDEGNDAGALFTSLEALPVIPVI